MVSSVYVASTQGLAISPFLVSVQILQMLDDRLLMKTSRLHFCTSQVLMVPGADTRKQPSPACQRLGEGRGAVMLIPLQICHLMLPLSFQRRERCLYSMGWGWGCWEWLRTMLEIFTNGEHPCENFLNWVVLEIMRAESMYSLKKFAVRRISWIPLCACPSHKIWWGGNKVIVKCSIGSKLRF